VAQAPRSRAYWPWPHDSSLLHLGTMAKMLWLSIAAACLCQSCATAVHGAEVAAVHGAEGIVKAAVAHAPAEAHEEGVNQAAVILLGMIVFIVLLYYMVNSHIHGVKKQTWAALSTAVSIFVAVMANNTINHLFRAEGEHHATMDKVWKDAGQLCVTTFLVAVLLFLQRASKLRIFAYGTIGGHILGFGAIDTFATVAGLPGFFHESPWHTLVVFVIYIFAIHVLVLPLRFTFHLLEKFCSGGNQSIEALEASKEQAADTSTDFFCMGGAYLLSMTIRGLIKGRVVEEEAESIHHTGNQVTWLVVVGFVFALLAGVIRVLQHHAQKDKFKKKTTSIKLLDTLGTLASLTCAWCLLDSGNWYWLHHFPEDKMVGHMAVALEATVFFIICVYGFSLAAKHVGPDVKQTLKGEFLSVGLMLGLAWEHVFDAALEGVVPFIQKLEEKKPTPGGTSIAMALLTFGLVLTVFPAWVVYIVPKAEPELFTPYMTPLAAFCDCERAEEDESEEEEEEEEALVDGE